MSAAQAGGARYRWAVLAAGTFAQAGYTSVLVGLTVLAPALRARYGLGLAEVGVVIAAPNIGSIATLYSWGRAADHFGDRAVIAVGLGAAAVCVAATAFVASFSGLALLFVLAGAFGASVNSASGRAVMHWFDAESRGLALGLRQTAVPISGALTAVALPLLARHHDPKPALLALAGLCVAGAAVALLVIREGPVPEVVSHREPTFSPLRDRRIWRLSAAAALMIEPQTCLVGFFVVFLEDHRGMTTTTAAGALAVLNVLGIATRVGAGRWSDLARSRVGPLRRIAVGSAALVVLCALLESAPLALLVPALVLMGCVTISWNGLSFAATAEVAGHARSGAALGVQQTALALSGAVLPIAFGGLVAATSWRTGFVVSAAFPLAGWLVLRSVAG
ncbi:MAG TPA: MFS transporter [Gaiellaceae bacterium]|nr:MFS transporter [Gaiellaceae bacterium]